MLYYRQTDKLTLDRETLQGYNHKENVTFPPSPLNGERHELP